MPRTAPYRAKFPHNTEILDGMVKGCWASHWATEQEDKGRSFSGQNILDVAPKPPGWARTWGKKLADAIVQVNHVGLEDLYRKAVEISGYPHDAETFGYHLGMEATGTGSKWTDDARGPEVEILVPDMEFYQGANPDFRFTRGEVG